MTTPNMPKLRAMSHPAKGERLCHARARRSSISAAHRYPCRRVGVCLSDTGPIHQPNVSQFIGRHWLSTVVRRATRGVDNSNRESSRVHVRGRRHCAARLAWGSAKGRRTASAWGPQCPRPAKVVLPLNQLRSAPIKQPRQVAQTCLGLRPRRLPSSLRLTAPIGRDEAAKCNLSMGCAQ